MQTHVAANIKAELARRDKTQEDLAAVLNISRQGISQRLLGRVAFRVYELQKIADYLGVPVAELLADQTEASA